MLNTIVSPLLICRLLRCFLLLATCVGCGSGNPLGRLAVNGKVTLDGAPLDQGTIEFSPEAANGVSSGANIKDGAYAISTTKGLPPGKYLVRINSLLGSPAGQKDRPEGAAPGMGSLRPHIERIAPTYNRESRIVVEVVAGQTAAFNFDTKSKPR
jgi:hypothetical protein